MGCDASNDTIVRGADLCRSICPAMERVKTRTPPALPAFLLFLDSSGDANVGSPESFVWMEQTGEDSLGQAQILVTVGRSFFSSTGGEGPGIDKSSEDHDEEFLGNRRPDPSLICVCTCAHVVGRRSRSSDIPDCRRHVSDA